MGILYSTYGAVVRQNEQGSSPFIGSPDLIPCGGNWNLYDIKIDGRYLYVGTEGDGHKNAGACAASTVNLSNADLIEIQVRIPHTGYYYYAPFRHICSLMDTQEHAQAAFVTTSYDWQNKKISISYYSNGTTVSHESYNIEYNPEIVNLKVDTHTWDFTLVTWKEGKTSTDTFTGTFANPVNLSTEFPFAIATGYKTIGDGVGIKIDYTDTFIKINNELVWGCQRIDGT